MSIKQEKFKNNYKYFICPKCKSPLLPKANSLQCKNLHSFDIAKKGYINFLLKQRVTDGYNKENFEYRNEILNAGYYDHILNNIKDIINYYTPSSLIDIGCGEGFYSKNIESPNIDILSFDFSKDAINIASRGTTNILFFIADIGNIPIKDKSINMILNIYTPANYNEFKRILKNNGLIVKVIPGNNHLKELRQLVSNDLKTKEYSNKDVKDIFNEKCNLIKNIKAEKKYKIENNNLDSLIQMTPLLFGKNKNNIDKTKLKEITIDAEILIGKIK